MVNFNILKARKSFRLQYGRDLHAHLIPGIDDGPDTIEEALELIQGMRAMGLKRLIATPHVYKQFYPNSKEKILDGYILLKNQIARQGWDVELEVAAEYFLDDHFDSLLDNQEVLPIAEKFLLVETSFVAAPPRLHNYLFKAQTKGYKPILAHPERYVYMTMDDYEELLDIGCQFQANLLSFTGYYGDRIKKNAFKLLKKGWLHALGTDIHNIDQLSITDKLLSDYSLRKLSEQQWLNEFI